MIFFYTFANLQTFPYIKRNIRDNKTNKHILLIINQKFIL